jgi:hypothetical protein
LAGERDEDTAPGGAIQRRDLEPVIRRAVELSAAAADPEERIAEEEVLRIGAELGLSPVHMLQAIQEAPGEPDRSLAARIFGPARVVGTRVVPLADTDTLHRLEEYLTARELLQLRRRQSGMLRFEPAEDTLSSLLRVFRRPAGRFHLAHARRVEVRARPLEPRRAVVAVDLDLAQRRRAAARQGGVVGAIFGVTAGGAASMLVGGLVAGWAGIPEGIVAGGVAGAAAFGTALGGTLTAFAGRFRSRLEDARNEVDALLDRLERGERLDPPPAPWTRRFAARPQRPALPR